LAAYGPGAQLAARFLGAAVRAGQADRAGVALTFDDGPSPHTTPRVLDVLDTRGAAATFFLLGLRAEAHPETAHAIAAAGHELGNHTYSHRHAWTLGPIATWHEVRAGAESIAAATGVTPAYFRPPWGICSLAALAAARRLGERVVGWTVASEGYFWRPGPRAMAEHLLAYATPGAILNLHDAGRHPDTPERVLAALPLLLDGLAARGLACVTLSELLA
jgi:peptidoglycan/xylan/chitin deacetylase (PgdA/CDA1 family)